MAYSLSFTKAILVVIFVSDKIMQKQYDYIATSMISKVLNIPKPTLVKILQSLHTAGIIETKEGKHGGVRLIKSPDEISVLDIFNALEKGKPLFNYSFDIHARGKRPDKAMVSLSGLFTKAESQMKNELQSKTIADILEEMN
jgi:Rrf2 family protein